MNTLSTAGGPRLVHLIAVRLIVVGVLFAFLNIALVVAMYARDKQSLAEDLVVLEIAAIADAVELVDGKPRVVEPVHHAVDRIGFRLFDSHGELLHDENPHGLALPDKLGRPELETLTSYEQSADSFVVAGTRRQSVADTDYWVAVAIAGDGLAPLLPGLAYELMEHVAVPLVPLSLLLLLFNLRIVKRMLSPLETAVAEVNQIDLAQPGSQLQLPASPAEVRTLLSAINLALARMQQAILRLQQFTADAAHELRTPLSVMTLRIEQLPAGELRGKLQEDAAAMTRMVNQMLDLARADALEVPADARTNLDALARNVVAHLLPLALKDGRSISYDQLAAPDVVGQSELLERALRNVLQNALNHTPSGSTVEVTVGPSARIRVRDHGPGIPAAIREQVVQRFWRPDRSKGQGAGLGLAITQTIMAAHGGQVVFDEAPDGGAVVTLEFASADPEGGKAA